VEGRAKGRISISEHAKGYEENWGGSRWPISSDVRGRSVVKQIGLVMEIEFTSNFRTRLEFLLAYKTPRCGTSSRIRESADRTSLFNNDLCNQVLRSFQSLILTLRIFRIEILYLLCSLT